MCFSVMLQLVTYVTNRTSDLNLGILRILYIIISVLVLYTNINFMNLDIDR